MLKYVFVFILFSIAIENGSHANLFFSGGGSSDSISIKDGPNLDAFQRVRVSEPYTLFDSKQVFDNQPLLWDDAQTSGGGTGTSHSTNTASTSISVSNATAGTRVRQTYQRFNYQPGKSQLILMTGIIGASAGTIRRIGYFDGSNGLFFISSNSVMGIGVRTNTSGTPTDTVYEQTSWNLDRLDGTGPSGYTFRPSSANIYGIDFEWLGVGRVRFFVVIDGKIIYAHQILNANNTSNVYMSSPNLPLRYEITNTGTGAAGTMTHICSSVSSEGGQEKNGVVRSTSTRDAQTDANTAGTLYGVLGMRLKTNYVGTTVENIAMSMIGTTVNDNYHWQLVLNPTVAGSVAWSDVTNSAVQISTGATANTITGGTLLNSGYAIGQSAISEILVNTLKLGSKIDGTLDTVWLCVMPVAGASNLDIRASLTWREIQ